MSFLTHTLCIVEDTYGNELSANKMSRRGVEQTSRWTDYDDGIHRRKANDLSRGHRLDLTFANEPECLEMTAAMSSTTGAQFPDMHATLE